MVDVTDRMALPSRNRLVREGSGMSSSGAGSLGNIKDLKTLLSEQEPMPGSSTLSGKQVDEIMQSTAKIIGDASVDWSKRITMMKNFRALCCDPQHHNQIVLYIRHLTPPLQNAVKDLRSQVGREACLTVAFMAQQLGVRSEYLMEPIMGTLFTLLIANAKVISIAGSSTILVIYESVHTHRLIPPLQTQMQHKSKEIRRAVCSVLKVIFENWPIVIIQKQLPIIIDILKKGLTDADAEARMLARECYTEFQKLLPSAATAVVDSLDALSKRKLLASINQQQAAQASGATASLGLKTNGTTNNKPNTSSLTRQGSIKKTGIPMLSSRASPVKTVNSGRSTSAIDLQAANRARQHHFSTLNNRTPLSKMGRTNSIATSSTASHNYASSSHSPSSIPTSISCTNQTPAGTPDRSRQRSRISRLSHSQPGSRSNSPSSKFAYATYSSPYAQHQNHPEGAPTSLISPPGRPGRRFSATSSASSSRDTSPTGRFGSKLRSRSVSQSPQVMAFNPNSSTAKLLLASREAEAALADGFKRDISDFDYGNHSDSEDSYTSRTSNRSFMSEFSPTSSRGHNYTDDVEELLTKCGSAKWSERKEGLLGLQNYLARHGSLPPKYLSKIGQTFCRIFMDAHTKVLSLFLDVLHAVLYRHAKDLIDFTSILLNRVLTKLGSDLLTSVQTKLMKTLEILMEEIPADVQFSAVTHYLCDPTQTPNSRSRVAALCHIYNLSAVSIAVKVDELQALVEKLLDWCSDTRSHELRRMSQKVFYALFEMAAPQMTIVLGQMAPHKQDQAKLILKNHVTNESSPKPINNDERLNISGGWGSIHSDIQALSINDSSDGSLRTVMAQLASAPAAQKSIVLSQFLASVKETQDDKLIENHKEILKLIFDTLILVSKPSDKALCFCCLEEMCSRAALASSLSAFAELIIVRVTDVQTAQMARDVTKAAENCGMALAINFPPEILVRALCPIVQNKEFPVNQMAIKMLQRMCDSCEIEKLRAFLPDIMNTLIQAYDHPDSAVRKAAVFAMVVIHIRIGPELQPYLSSLSGSKLKLLQLYIQRAQQGSTGS